MLRAGVTKFGVLTTRSGNLENTGVGQTQLSKYEKELSAPTLELLLKLKSYSGRSLDWIVTGGEGA
jgi:transcriptional regulator with XRE-family HTH domain